jgi:hypothetical protein
MPTISDAAANTALPSSPAGESSDSGKKTKLLPVALVSEMEDEVQYRQEHHNTVLQTFMRLSPQPSSIKIFNKNAVWTRETKYLGVTLDSKLTCKARIASLMRKANCRLRQLFPVPNKPSTADENLALTVHKSLLQSILTYASPAWGYAADCYTHKLQTFQNKAGRMKTKLPRAKPVASLHEQTATSLINKYVKGLATNCPIQEARHYDPRNDKYFRPRSLLAR